MAIAAGVLADDPDLSLAELAAELRQETTRLAALTDDTGGVHAGFTTSWTRLRARDPGAARLLCLLTVNPGPDLSEEAAAAIIDEDSATVRIRLRRLTQAHLLLSQRRRWRFHGLIRLAAHQYAISGLGITEPWRLRTTAPRRMRKRPFREYRRF